MLSIEPTVRFASFQLSAYEVSPCKRGFRRSKTFVAERRDGRARFRRVRSFSACAAAVALAAAMLATSAIMPG
ncbi:hypothetical protein LP419_37800 [Massilia sp. H-1]|nr:hypothetical protein LP419_37800 [Massilia sp. H-1]